MTSTTNTTLSQRGTQLQVTLSRLRANRRVSQIVVLAPQDCVLGQSIQGLYNPDEVPELPAEGCSRPGGCICRYEPFLSEIFP